jgi:hypothetical protein
MNPKKNPALMPSGTSYSKSTPGKLFFVSGLSGGREVFLGKAIDEPYEQSLTLEGKVLALSPQGIVVARPFNTTSTFSIKDPVYNLQHISDPHAHEEAIHILNFSVTQVSKTVFPLICRWIETAAQTVIGTFPTPFFAATSLMPNATMPQREVMFNGVGQSNPFYGFYQGFQSTAEQFRRSLFHSRQVNSTRELDKVAELEGNLAIEIGKLANQLAVKFHQIATQESELYPYLEAFQGADLPATGVRYSMAGWLYLFQRLQFAKSWARRDGKPTLVRDINVLIKDGIFGLNEVILDHCNSLDTLITETFSQYGIAYEIYGELSPFVGYTGPAPSALDRETAAVGASS